MSTFVLFDSLMSNKLLLDKVPICVPSLVEFEFELGSLYYKILVFIGVSLSNDCISLSRAKNASSSCSFSCFSCKNISAFYLAT